MIAAMEKTGKQLAINWPLAWVPAHVKAHQLVAEGRIGEKDAPPSGAAEDREVGAFLPQGSRVDAPLKRYAGPCPLSAAPPAFA